MKSSPLLEVLSTLHHDPRSETTERTKKKSGGVGMLVVQYVGALAIPVLLPWGIGAGVVPVWVLSSFFAGTAFCYAAWEMFVTYGLAGGKCFMAREPNQFGALNGNAMNCILMSALDCAVLHLMLFLALWNPVVPGNWHGILPDFWGWLTRTFDKAPAAFGEWRLVPFVWFFVIGYGQGVAVALLHRRKCVKEGLPTLQKEALSWAPLIPTLPLSRDPLIGGPMYNFTSRIMVPWIAMPVIWQAMLIYGVFENPLPIGPLATISVGWLTLCFYSVFFASVFPTCGSTTPDKLGKIYPVPSFPSSPTPPPATSWPAFVLGVLAGWVVLLAVMACSYGVFLVTQQLLVL